MKKGSKIGLGIIVCITILLSIGSLVGGGVAKKYIINNSKELFGRTVSVENLKINALTGGVRAYGFEMLERDDKNVFLTFDTLAMRVRIIPLIFGRVSIPRLELTNANMVVLQNNLYFNFDDLTERFLSDTTETSLKATIKNIKFINSSIDYTDLVSRGKWNVENLSISIPKIILGGEESNMGLNLNLRRGGKLRSNIVYDQHRASYTMDLELEKMSADGLLPYFQQMLEIGSIDGILSAQMQVSGNLNHLMEFELSGSMEAKDVKIKDKDRETVLTADVLRAVMTRCRPGSMIFRLDSLCGRGVETQFVLQRDGRNNITSLMREENDAIYITRTTPQSTEAMEMQVRIGIIDLNSSKVKFVDKSLPKEFNYQMTNVHISAQDFDIKRRNQVEATADIGKGGKAHLRCGGSVSNLNNQNIYLRLTNIDLRDLEPYSLAYWGYPIKRGTMSATTQNVIENGRLTGTNKIDISNIEVGKLNKKLEPEYAVPLRTAIGVLKDSKGQIAMDIPVSGNISDPEFSYGKIVSKAIGGVFTRAISAPFRVLKSKKMKEITPRDSCP